MPPISEELRKVPCGDTVIDFFLARKKVRNINLRIKQDASVHISANNEVPVEAIETLVLSKRAIIFDALEKYKERQQFLPAQKDYVNGEGIRFLGKNLRIKLIEGQEENVVNDGVYIYLTVKDLRSRYRKQTYIETWLGSQARKIFEDVNGEVFLKFRKYGVKRAGIIIKDMVSRWGSCQPKRGTITLNKRLSEAPRFCIEYVMMHEYVHFIYSAHSRKFYAMLQTMMPDWKERKKILESREYYLPNLHSDI